MSTAPDDGALKPCPFCGGAARLECYDGSVGSRAWRVICEGCSARTDYYVHVRAKRLAAAAWNRRDGAGEEGPR